MHSFQISLIFSPIKKLFHSSGRILIIAAIVAPTSFISISIYRAWLNHNAQTSFCAKIHKLDVGIQNVLFASIPTKEGLNKITYYRLHPIERDIQISSSQQFILFQINHNIVPADCPKQ